MKNLENLRLRRDHFLTFLWLCSSMSWCQAATLHRMFCYGEMAVEKRLFWKNQYGLRLRVRSGFVFKKVGIDYRPSQTIKNFPRLFLFFGTPRFCQIS